MSDPGAGLLAVPGNRHELLLASNAWQERWISGPTTNAGAFALIAFNDELAELTITEFDERVFVIARHEWLPLTSSRDGDAERAYELTITDWDEHTLQRRDAFQRPIPPTSRDQLQRLLTELEIPD